MVLAEEPTEPGPLRALGVATGRLVGVAALCAVVGGSGCLAAGTGLAVALGVAAGFAGAVAATAWSLGAGLHRTVVVPISACRRHLAEAAAGRAPGPLPEPGAPLLRDLVTDVNTAAATFASRPAASAPKPARTAAPPPPAPPTRLPASVHEAQRLLAEALRRAAPVLSRLGVRAELAAEGASAVHCEGEDLLAVFARLCEAAAERSRAGGTVHAVVLGLPDHVEVTIAEDRPGVRTLRRDGEPGASGPPPGCRTAVAALGGTLQQEDSPLGGLQFRLVLPAAALAARH